MIIPNLLYNYAEIYSLDSHDGNTIKINKILFVFDATGHVFVEST